jgi:hypothetical protein
MIPAVGRPCILESSKLSTEDDAEFEDESRSRSDLKPGLATKSNRIEGSSASETLDLLSPLVVTPEKLILPEDQVLILGTDDPLPKKKKE